jgi:hypothetical protein
MGALTTTERVKRSLQIPSGVTVHDARIAEIVTEVEAEMLAQTTLSAWSTTTHTDYLDTRVTSDVVLLKRFPVISVVAATLVVGSTPLVENEDYQWEESGKIARLPEGEGWPQGRRQLVVTYTVGAFAAGSTLADLTRAATLMSARQYVLEPVAGLSDAQVEPLRRTVAEWDVDAMRIEVDRTLARYRNALG